MKGRPLQKGGILESYVIIISIFPHPYTHKNKKNKKAVKTALDVPL